MDLNVGLNTSQGTDNIFFESKVLISRNTGAFAKNASVSKKLPVFTNLPKKTQKTYTTYWIETILLSHC